MYTRDVGWNSMAMRWYREKNGIMACLLLVPTAKRVGKGYVNSVIHSAGVYLALSDDKDPMYLL